MVSLVFRHWLRFDFERTALLIWSRRVLLILPISDFAGLISRHFMLLGKLGLWSLILTKASRLGKRSILLSNRSLVAIVFASAFQANCNCISSKLGQKLYTQN